MEVNSEESKPSKF